MIHDLPFSTEELNDLLEIARVVISRPDLLEEVEIEMDEVGYYDSELANKLEKYMNGGFDHGNFCK